MSHGNHSPLESVYIAAVNLEWYTGFNIGGVSSNYGSTPGGYMPDSIKPRWLRSRIYGPNDISQDFTVYRDGGPVVLTSKGVDHGSRANACISARLLAIGATGPQFTTLPANQTFRRSEENRRTARGS